MRSSVISQYDFLRVLLQSPLGHRQRPFLFALQIEPAQMIFQTVTSAEPIFDGRPWSSRRPMANLLEDLSREQKTQMELALAAKEPVWASQSFGTPASSFCGRLRWAGV
jgi:hypothetical protein